MSALQHALRAGTVRPLGEQLGLKPGDVEAIVRFAAREEARGRHSDAIETLRVAAVLDPRAPQIWDGLARCYGASGDESRAASAARVAAAVRRAMTTRETGR